MRDFDKTLRDLGLQLEMVSVPDNAGAVGATVGEAEQRGRGGFFIIQIDRRSAALKTLTRPGAEVKIEAGDGALIVSRAPRSPPCGERAAGAGRAGARRPHPCS